MLYAKCCFGLNVIMLSFASCQAQCVHAGTILCMPPANDRLRYIVTASLIGWTHTQNDPCSWWQLGPEINADLKGKYQIGFRIFHQKIYSIFHWNKLQLVSIWSI